MRISASATLDGVLFGNRRFQSIHSLYWRLLRSRYILLQTNLGLKYSLSNILKCKLKSYCILKVGLSQFIAAVEKHELSET